MTPDTDLAVYMTAIAAASGAALRHFLPAFFKADFWAYNKQSTNAISYENHEKLCQPIKNRLDEGEVHFNAITDEVRYIRTLVVIQAPPDAIKKADEIIGKRSQ